MQRWKEFLRTDRTCLSRPATMVQFLSVAIFIFALGLAFVLPVSDQTHLKLMIAAIAGLAYAVFIWTPYLPNRRALVDVHPIGIALLNALVFSFITYLLFDVISMIAIIYVLPIINGAIRHGRRFAVGNAFLASVSYLIVLQILNAQTTLWNHWLIFTVLFGMHALLAGSLAAALERRTLEFKNIVHYSRDAIVILDHAGRIEYLNPAAVNLGGYSVEELRDRTLIDLIVPTERANAQRTWENLLAGVIPDRAFVVHILPKNGVTRTLAITLAPFDLKRNRFAIFARDITAHEQQQQEHERRHRELDAEHAVASAVSQTLALDQVLHVALAKVLETLQYDAGAIYLADEAQTTLTIAVTQNLSDAFIQKVSTHFFGKGITGRAAAQREILFEFLPPERGQIMLDHEGIIRTQISVPLIYHDRVVGVLNINSLQEQIPTATDLALLRTIAATLAVAIDRARLFETLEQRVAQRTAELATLNRIITVSTQSLDLTTLLDATLVELIRALQIEGSWIFRVNREQGTLQMLAQRGIPATLLDQPPLLRLGEDALGQVALTGQGRVIDIEQLESCLRTRLREAGIQSVGAVALTAHGHVIGVLTVYSGQKNRFSAADLRWLEAVGTTVAVAMQNAQLFESVERQLKQITTLREIDSTLNSLLDLEPMLDAVLEAVAQLVPYDYAAIFLVEGDWLRAVAGRGISAAHLQHLAFDLSAHPGLRRRWSKRQPIILDRVHHSSDWITQPGLEEVQSWMGVPFIARDQVLGQLSLYHRAPNAFTQEHRDLMWAFANHAAIAIANARLRAELHEQARRDSLTHVLNHGAFIHDLRLASEQAIRHHQALSLIMLDLDNFKQYNDTYGHVVGDEVLCTTVQAIRTHIKQTDLVGRWGGEEFGIGLLNANHRQALLVAERIRQTLALTRIHDRHGTPIPSPTASQGIAVLGRTAYTLDDLIEQADRALYQAKQRGKNQIVCAE